MSLLPQEIVRAKRDGGSLDRTAIDAFVAGVTSGAVTDAQIAAFAMAVFFRGLDRAETVALTRAMRDSGTVLDWAGADGPVLDKHSTGGVGDNLSLMLAPIVAAAGGVVPMISGRGLGHTGGTLDKMDSIPGYTTQPDIARFRRAVGEAGCAIIGQTGDLAPADKRIYGVRDVTATVEEVSLITASILSKKLAAGLEGLVLDVKTGSGAFMASEDEARRLATSLVEVANGAGLPTVALLTDMDEPLGRHAGNAVEVASAVRFLTGAARDPKAEDVTLALAGEMLALGRLAEDAEKGRGLAADALRSGRAAERFALMVEVLGGPADFMERFEVHLPKAPFEAVVKAEEAGTVVGLDTRAIGLAVVALGGGRTRAEDGIDHAVGLTEIVAKGESVEKGQPLALIHARDETTAEAARRRLLAAITFGDATPAARPAIIGRIDAARAADG